MQRGHHRSFVPVYVDELYSQPKGLSVMREEESQPNTSKLARDTDRTGAASTRHTCMAMAPTLRPLPLLVVAARRVLGVGAPA
jgi:hypothetical protein